MSSEPENINNNNLNNNIGDLEPAGAPDTAQPAVATGPMSERELARMLGPEPEHEHKARSFDRRQLWVTLGSYVLAYIYTLVLLPDYRVRDLVSAISFERFGIGVFTIAYIALAAFLFWKRPRSRESYFWFASLVIACAGACFGQSQVWGHWAWWGLHGLAVWWVLVRGSALHDSGSSALLPLDALWGFIIYPFGHFFDRILALRQLIRTALPSSRKLRTPAAGYSVLALCLGFMLFCMSTSLLGQADTRFSDLFHNFWNLFSFELDELVGIRLVMSLPVGAYICGLFQGVYMHPTQALHERADEVRKGIATLRRVPDLAWLCITVMFCAAYGLFFYLQAEYLFGAFSHHLPDGFIVSEYARQGFFELCQVMAVNFALLWLLRYTTSGTRGRAMVIWQLVLLLESVLFAVVAFSKLMLYISCFGFTPLRLQSSYLVCVLFVGCICYAVSLLSQKRMFRVWMWVSAALYVALALY